MPSHPHVNARRGALRPSDPARIRPRGGRRSPKCLVVSVGFLRLDGSTCADPRHDSVGGTSVRPADRAGRDANEKETTLDIGEHRRDSADGQAGAAHPMGGLFIDPVPGVVQRQRLEADRDLPGHRRGVEPGRRAGAHGDRADRPDDPPGADLDPGGRAGRPAQQAGDHRRHQGLRVGPDAGRRGGADRPARRRPLDLGILGLLGVQAALFGPSKYGIIPELVPHERLSRANGFLEMGSNLAILSGMVAGAVILHFAKELGRRSGPAACSSRGSRPADSSPP